MGCGGHFAERLAPQVSFVVRIVPSPDWFVGVDSLDLCDGSRWREQVTVDLHPHDAGTDSGFTFSSPNFATVPQDTVTEVRGPACSLFGRHPVHSPQGPSEQGCGPAREGAALQDGARGGGLEEARPSRSLSRATGQAPR